MIILFLGVSFSILETRTVRILSAFSARENFQELTKTDESNSSLRILYGVRTICIFFVIMEHRFGTFLSSALMNFDYYEKVNFCELLVLDSKMNSVIHDDEKINKL